MRVKLVTMLFTCVCAAQLSKAQSLALESLSSPEGIVVSNTSMSPEQPLTITLATNNYFLINGEKSGYWRVIMKPTPIMSSSLAPTITPYELYLKNPTDNKDIVCLSFEKVVSSPAVRDMQGRPLPITVRSVHGSNVTGYFMDGGQRMQKTLNFSPATESGVGVKFNKPAIFLKPKSI